MKYFKVIRGFGDDDFIPIDETELDVAVYAQMTGKMAFLKNGSINGSHISSIKPDFHRAMGWNYGHGLKAPDWQQLNDAGVAKQYIGCLTESKQRIHYLLQMKRPDLIGQPETALAAAGLALPSST